MLINPDHKRLNLRAPSVWIATWFGFGLIAKAPGTWGSLAALSPGLALGQHFGVTGLLCGTVLVSMIGYWAAARFQKISGAHDSKMIVIDEVAGQWVALLPVIYLAGTDLTLTALAFVLFRFFDIAKPRPIAWIDRNIKGALGVMADDIVAGAAAALCVTGAIYA